MKLNVESDLIKQQFRASVLLKLTISVRISVDSGSTENKYGIHKRTTEKRMKKKHTAATWCDVCIQRQVVYLCM